LSHVNDVTLAVVVLLMAFVSLLLILLVVKFERLLDRYRLKYGFDREIERKETSGDNTSQNEKLNRRERLFKRRVFKD
jgi:hypothetical protein